MKSYFKNFQVGLTSLLVSLLMIVSINGIAQQSAVTLDPKLGTIRFTDVMGNTVNENYIQPGQVVKLVIPVASLNQTSAMPKGSCKIKIGLGSKLMLDPTYNLNTINSSNYFTWSVQNGGGQSQLTGELNTELPQSFQEVEVGFKVLGNQVGHSTVTANFLITNHNTNIILSDNDGSNNASYLGYEITNVAAPTPVTVINELAKVDCSMKITFSTDREMDLKKYEVEISKNGVDFVKVYELNAIGAASYTATVAVPADMQSSVVYARVKSIAVNGRVAYTENKTISGICNTKWEVSLYPNPVKRSEEATIKAVTGIFNGTYSLVLVDLKGSVISSKRVVLNNVTNFKYNVTNLAASKYSLKIASADGKQSAVLQFEIL